MFDGLNKIFLFGSTGAGLVIGSSICGISAEIALSGFAGGLIGIPIGFVIGGLIIGIRALFNYASKKEDFLKLLNKSKNQYNEILGGIKFSIETKIEETDNYINDLIENTINFLNKEITNIQNDKWTKAKNELINISNKFEELYGKKMKKK